MLSLRKFWRVLRWSERRWVSSLLSMNVLSFEDDRTLWDKRKNLRNPNDFRGFLHFTALIVTPVGPENIVVTKSYSEYCNAALPVVHELYTAQFQCSSPLFPLGNAKLIKFGQITKSYNLKVK